MSSSPDEIRAGQRPVQSHTDDMKRDLNDRRLICKMPFEKYPALLPATKYFVVFYFGRCSNLMLMKIGRASCRERV